MAIQLLRVSGYRSLREIEWEPGPLNVVIGPNGSGKSNLLRSIEWLQLAAAGQLSKMVLDEGGLQQILWDRRVETLSWFVRTDPLGEGRDMTREALTYELTLAPRGQGGDFRIENEALANYYLKDKGEKDQPKYFLRRRPGHAVIYDFQERGLVAPEGDIRDDQILLALGSAPFVNEVVSGFRDTLRDWAIYHGADIGREASIRQPAVARYVKRLAPDCANLIPVLHTLYTGDRTFKSTLDAAMRAAFGEAYEELVFPPAADQRVQLRVRWRSLEYQQSAADLSDGTLRFLILIAVLADPAPPKLIAIDEPETGLHPSMLPIVCELACEASERTQIIFTTHSPEFLDAFGETVPTTTVAHCQEGETKLAVLDGENLDRWLKSYSLGTIYQSGDLEALA